MSEYAPSERPPVSPPLLRDPPLPPGYSDPLEGAAVLDEPFTDPVDRGTEAEGGDRPGTSS